MEGAQNSILPLMDDDAHGSDGEEEPPDVETDLANFRIRWQDELEQAKLVKLKKVEGQHCDPKIEDEAKILFLRGVRAEQLGSFYEAIQLYRRSMQLVPDIEHRIDYMSMRSPRERQESESSIGSVDLEDDDLVTSFQKLRTNDNYAICYPEYEQRGMHISDLPIEVINYILKWVVSNDLDLKTLENISEVCRGFYVLSRDEELWRLICQRIWGVNCGKCKKYGGWRNMYMERPHLLYNGCYIAKCSYMRQGENTFDTTYRPWQIVEYYRYARFFPEGVMLMSTSPNDPLDALSKLKCRHSRDSGVLKGYYRLSGDRVMGVLKRIKSKEHMTPFQKYKRNRRQQQLPNYDYEQTFHVEFEVVNAGKRKFNKLQWLSYSITTLYKHSGKENVADFDITDQIYPPMVFSRVKSYTVDMEAPLSPWKSTKTDQ